MNRRIGLVGVPTDIGAGMLGCCMGPAALRVAGLSAALAARGFDVVDAGDVAGPATPCTAPVEGHRHLPEVVAWSRATHDATIAQLRQGRLPIVMGGDHSIAIGSISAVARYCREQGKRLRVLWLDAHADFNTGAMTPSGNLHGMPVACLCGHGPEPLVSLSGCVPALHAADVRQVGIRSVDDGEEAFVRQEQLPVFYMHNVRALGIEQVLQHALDGLDESWHLHVSFDVDFLDPGIAPAVGTAVESGPGYAEARTCMELIARTGRVGSIDLVELNPALDVRSQTAALCVDLIERLLAGDGVAEPMGLAEPLAPAVDAVHGQAAWAGWREVTPQRAGVSA